MTIDATPTPTPESERSKVIAMNTMTDRFQAIETGDDVYTLIHGLGDEPSPIAMETMDNAVELEAVWEAASRRCHVCASEIARGDIAVEHFQGADTSMAVHQGCHLVRVGQSSESIMLSLKIGIWVVREIMSSKADHKWKPAALESWTSQCGAGIGQFVIGSGVPWWDRGGGINSIEQLVRWVRYLFIYEREAPKFAARGGRVPDWNEANVSWDEYKALFYESLPQSTQQRGARPSGPPVLDRTDGRCAMCGGAIGEDPTSGKSPLALAIDHIMPWCLGGEHALGNFQPLHHFCNGGLSSISGGQVPLGLQIGRWAIECLRASDGKGLDQWREFANACARHFR